MKEMEQRRKGPMVRMGAFLGIGKGEKEHRVACDYGEPPLRSIFLFSIFFSVYGIFFFVLSPSCYSLDCPICLPVSIFGAILYISRM
jgi:hypothetical protein